MSTNKPHNNKDICDSPSTNASGAETYATELIQELYFPLEATKTNFEKSDKVNTEGIDAFLQGQLKRGNFCLEETNTAINTLSSANLEGKSEQSKIAVLDNCFNNLRTTIDSIGRAEDEGKILPKDSLRQGIVQDLRDSFENCRKQYHADDKDLNNPKSLLRALKELKNDILILRKDEHIERLANYANFVGSTEKQLPLDSVLLSIHKASSQASYFADTITNVISVQDNALPANNENQTLTITALKTLEKDLGQRIDILENITSLYNNEPVGNSNSGSQKLVEMSNLFPDKLYTDQTNIIFTKDKSWNKLREHISGSINTFKKLNTLIDRLDEDADNATLLQIKAISTDLANKLSLNDYTRVGADTAGTYWNAWHTTGQWSQRLSYLSLPSDYKNILVNSKELSDSLNSLYNTELFQGTGKHLKPISPDLIGPILSKQITSIENGIKSLKHNLDHCSAASELDQLIIERGTANFRLELPNFEDKFVKLKTLSLEISSPTKIRGKQLSNIYQEINALAESLSSDLAFLHQDSIAESTQVGGIEKIGLF